jgi:hypothetical protein
VTAQLRRSGGDFPNIPLLIPNGLECARRRLGGLNVPQVFAMMQVGSFRRERSAGGKRQGTQSADNFLCCPVVQVVSIVIGMIRLLPASRRAEGAASRAHDLNQTNALGRFCGPSRQHSRRAAISKKNPGPPGCRIRDRGAWLRGLARPGKVEGFPLPALAEHKS